MQDLINKLIDKTLTGKGDSDQHLMTLFSLTIQTKAKNILELGMRQGTTTEPLLLGAYLNKGLLTSVDISSPYGFNPQEELKMHHLFVQQDAIEFLQNQISIGKYYDLVFVDDWHSYRHVKKELELLDKLTDEKSLIIMHDTMAFTFPQYHWPIDSPADTEWGEGGPTRALFEFVDDVNNIEKDYEFCTIPVNNGLTILRKRK